MRVKWQSQNSKKNMVVFKRLIEENPTANFQKLAEMMTVNGCVSKGGREISYGAVQWMWKKMHKRAKSKSKRGVYHVSVTPKSSPKRSDKLDVFNMAMASNLPDTVKLEIAKVLANVP